MHPHIVFARTDSVLYTVNSLAKLANTTARTLRFYDTIGLLKPAHVADNRYRLYGKEQVLRLQQILFFKELGFELKHIQEALAQPDFDQQAALKAHKAGMLENIKRIRGLIQTIDKTLAHVNNNEALTDAEIFKGLNGTPAQAEIQTKLINNWTNHFGEEGRQQLKDAIDATRHWTLEELNHYYARVQKIIDQLAILYKENLSADDLKVQDVIQAHFNILAETQTITKEFYCNLGRYICSEEHKKAFDAIQEGLSEYFSQAIHVFAERNL
jgi:DNA-binding transcriptional MerR regulator